MAEYWDLLQGESSRASQQKQLWQNPYIWYDWALFQRPGPCSRYTKAKPPPLNWVDEYFVIHQLSPNFMPLPLFAVQLIPSHRSNNRKVRMPASISGASFVLILNDESNGRAANGDTVEPPLLA
ncbi:uncharacterized protein MCYG_02974 [Microsporum canis CBS 113480]|uniref:Uncharacterized protein n=1 Tax=Arthroderma otae (strain ATCC MYA-4605 / CBS 113480) TaxID=554155 RepID=C5FKD3_ARTOC|nr:uncharacterized protein MCYG_02974 [Microsporum canis CBS 113480]EEQ30155.1 predicted protein [Microsporum canis CBS 113480]